jgi:hypothetical protein
MSANEIIDQMKALPQEERNRVLDYFSATQPKKSLYDDFTILGSDVEGSDVSHAIEAQREVLGNEHP